MKASSLNPNAPVYIPGGLVVGKEGPSGVLPGRTKLAIPTAKVPNYVKRLGRNVRDDKPGLLPTPDIPIMRSNAAGGFGYPSPYTGTGIYGRSFSMDYADDPYATPYAAKMQRKSDSIDLAPPGFEITESGIFSTPPGFSDSASSLLGGETKSVSGDSLESLLALLSQQLESSAHNSTSGGGSTTIGSVSSSAFPPSTPTLPGGKMAEMPSENGADVHSFWDPKRMETFDSEQSLFASIAGFYLPSDMN